MPLLWRVFATNALFLSPRTVETHVRNIFGQVGADSRVEVARSSSKRTGSADP